MIQPPTIGPTVGASTASTPAIVVAMPCRRSGNSRKTAANTAGISVPPAKPCSTRQAIRLPKLSDAGAADRGQREDRGRTDEQPAHGQHPRQQAGQRNRDDLGDQIGGLHPAHLVGRDVQRRLDVGSDVATICTSRIAMNMPMHIAREAGPGGQAHRTRVRTRQTRTTSRRTLRSPAFSARMRTARTPRSAR